MKKLVLSLIVVFAVSHSAMAQTPDALMAEVAKKENVQNQVLDKAMLDQSMAQAMENDSSGELKSKMPAFLNKIDSVRAVILANATPEFSEQMKNGVNAIKDDDIYSTLVKVKDEGDNVQIISRKEGGLSGVYVFVIESTNIVMVKLSGNFDASDLEAIVKEQTKNNN